MKKELWFILLGSVGILIALVIIMQGEPVTVTKSAPVVEVRRFDPKHPPPEVGPDADGMTTWKFLCPSEVSYKILEDVSDNGGSFARVRITSIKTRLGLRIVSWIPEGSMARVNEHEAGHALICKRIYQTAEAAAIPSARSIVGKVYRGSGKTLEEASTAAGSIALAEFGSLYDKEVVRKAQCVSELYDLLAKHKANPDFDKLVDHAFNLYEKGRPRTVSDST